jgi:hypothetical protein
MHREYAMGLAFDPFGVVVLVGDVPALATPGSFAPPPHAARGTAAASTTAPIRKRCLCFTR